MKKKMVVFLLLCVATLSMVSSCGGVALSFPATQPTDASPTVLTEVMRNALQNAKPPVLRVIPLGDSIDDPVPHTH